MNNKFLFDSDAHLIHIIKIQSFFKKKNYPCLRWKRYQDALLETSLFINPYGIDGVAVWQ